MKTTHAVKAISYFNGDKMRETTHTITVTNGQPKGLARIASPAGRGWGVRLVMDETAARDIGAYETGSAEWIINRPDLQVFVEIEVRS